MFPFLQPIQTQTTTTTIDIPKEFEYDFETDSIIVRNGHINIVEGLDAIKIWIYKALRTQRLRYDAYTINFGQDFEELVGSDLSSDAVTSEAKRMTEEALLVNKHILSINNFSIGLNSSNNIMELNFNAITDLGNISVSSNI